MQKYNMLATGRQSAETCRVKILNATDEAKRPRSVYVVRGLCCSRALETRRRHVIDVYQKQPLTSDTL